MKTRKNCKKSNKTSCCRACMHTDFSPTDELYALTDECMRMYSFCTSIELAEHDCLPKTLCQTCYDLLSKFHSFKNQCLKSNTALLEKYESDVEEKKFSAILPSDIKKEDDNDNDFSDDFPATDDGVDIKQESEGEVERPARKVKNKRPYKTTGKIFLCLEKGCQKKFKYEDSLEGHLLIDHKGLTIEIECHKCKDKKFPSFIKLHRHDAVVHQRNEIKCETCGKICRSSIALKLHLYTHKKFGAFVCQMCGKACNSKCALEEHEETHEKNRSRDHECEQCGNAYFSRMHLQKHVARTHRAKKYPCAVCSKTFPRALLKRHALVHAKAKPFFCTHCNRGYSSAWSLKQHTRMHTGEHPFSCGACSMSFVSKQFLAKHVEAKHAGTKIKLPAHAAERHTGGGPSFESYVNFYT